MEEKIRNAGELLMEKAHRHAMRGAEALEAGDFNSASTFFQLTVKAMNERLLWIELEQSSIEDDSPETITPVVAPRVSTVEGRAAMLSDIVCFHCGHPIRQGIDVLRYVEQRPRHAYICPDGSKWPEDKELTPSTAREAGI